MNAGDFMGTTELCEQWILLATDCIGYLKMQVEDKGHKTKDWPVTCYKNIPKLALRKYDLRKNFNNINQKLECYCCLLFSSLSVIQFLYLWFSLSVSHARHKKATIANQCDNPITNYYLRKWSWFWRTVNARMLWQLCCDTTAINNTTNMQQTYQHSSW